MKLFYLFLALTISLSSFAWNTHALDTTPTLSYPSPLGNNADIGIWHDLITPDLTVSKSFYKALFGWTYAEKNIKGFKYTLIYNGSKVLGGMIEVPNIQSSTWISSLPLEAAELNKRIKLAMANGAKLAIQPLKVAGLGKQVVLEGPQGSVFSLSSKNAFNSSLKTHTDSNSWLGMELWADNPAESKAFYEKTFEVTTEEISVDNKPYWYFKNGETPLAGMTKNPVTNQGSQWVPYVKVASPAAIVTATKQAGGDVILAPTDTIRNGKLTLIQDPHGALIAAQQ